jgi:hypothetical protein
VSSTINRRDVLRLGAGLGALSLLAACETTGFQSGSLGGSQGGSSPASGRSFGTGPVKVALLLPLTGDSALATVGVSMANAAQLAMDYVAATPKIGDNITLLLMDTGATVQGASQQASAAVADGVSLILGPLRGDQVEAAGSVARTAGIPLIGFSNNSAVAAPGIYLLNVLPESEVHRSLGYVTAHGRKSLVAVFPTTDFGHAQQAAFQTVAASTGFTAHSVLSYGSDSDMRAMIATLAPQIASGIVDAVFLPDRATAPQFATLLQRAGAPQGKALIVGSADWDGDTTITSTPYLVGAVYPAVDDTGYLALKAEYTARFGGTPHPLATVAYTAAILANASPLSMSNPKYGAAQLTTPGGFNGRDGVFRFLPDGRSQYALVMKQIVPGGATRIDGPKL